MTHMVIIEMMVNIHAYRKLHSFITYVFSCLFTWLRSAVIYISYKSEWIEGDYPVTRNCICVMGMRPACAIRGALVLYSHLWIPKTMLVKISRGRDSIAVLTLASRRSVITYWDAGALFTVRVPGEREKPSRDFKTDCRSERWEA